MDALAGAFEEAVMEHSRKAAGADCRYQVAERVRGFGARSRSSIRARVSLTIGEARWKQTSFAWQSVEAAATNADRTRVSRARTMLRHAERIEEWPPASPYQAMTEEELADVLRLYPMGEQAHGANTELSNRILADTRPGMGVIPL
jgi:hypothetical protein